MSRLNHINYNNVQIDNSIGKISDSLDTILNMSNTIGDEIKSQNIKLNQLENNMENISNKQSNITPFSLKFGTLFYKN